MLNFRQRTLSALTWSAAIQVVQYLFQFLISVVLARLLTPRDFGLIGMIMVFTGFAARFSDLGLGAALVQKLDINREHLDSVFWLNIVAGVFLASVFVLGAPLLALFYGEPTLVQLTRLLAPVFLLASLGIVHKVLLQKELDFKSIARVEAFALILAGFAAVGLAFLGLGVWSLVLQALIGTAVTAVLLWRFSPWRPRLVFDFRALKGLLRFSLNLMGFDFFNYWIRNFDNILIGRQVGSAPLGIYSRAYNIMLFPITRLSGVISRVMFPALSSIQEDTRRVKRIYLQVTRSIALLTFPLIVGMIVVADSFILAVYGSKWMEVTPILRLLCLAGLWQSIGTTVGWIYTSQGRTDIMFRWGIAAGLVRVVSIVIGIHWGIEGVAAAVVVSGYLLWYPSWSIPGRLIGLRFAEMLKNLLPALLCAAVMGGGVFALKFVLPSHWPLGWVLSAKVLSGMLVYFLLVYSFRVRSYVEVREIVLEKLKRRKTGKGEGE